MRVDLRIVLVAVLLVAGATGVACSSKFSCTSSECGVAPTAADTSECQAAESGACGSQYSDLANCAAGNSSSCVDGGGLAVLEACATQVQAVETCCEKNPTAAGCSTTTPDAG